MIGDRGMIWVYVFMLVEAVVCQSSIGSVSSPTLSCKRALIMTKIHCSFKLTSLRRCCCMSSLRCDSIVALLRRFCVYCINSHAAMFVRMSRVSDEDERIPTLVTVERSLVAFRTSLSVVTYRTCQAMTSRPAKAPADEA